MIQSLGITDKLEALPNQLSGGQQQRAAIARSDLPPALLLADEPTGNLDQKNSREIIDLLKLSNRNLKQTILLITHDEKIALEADRIVTIEDGRVISDRNGGGADVEGLFQELYQKQPRFQCIDYGGSLHCQTVPVLFMLYVL
ncbi:MAG: ATP-binding cassette domain-containing protein [Eisenbergiella sp.]